MVIASVMTGERRVLVLGLSEQNVERLQAGQPIRCSRASHGMAMPDDLTVFVFVGTTEEAIMHALADRGLIGHATVVNQQKPS